MARSRAEVNQELLDAGLRHWLGIQKYGTKLSRDAIRLLNLADKDIERVINQRLAAVVERGFDTGPWTTARLKAMQQELRRVNREAYAVVGKDLSRQLKELAGFSADFQVSSFDKASPIKFSYLKPSAEQLREIVENKPIEGRILGEWLERLETNRYDRMTEQLKIGLMQGEGIPQLSKRVLGASGVTRKSRRGTDALVRTAVADINNAARNEVYKANAEMLNGILIVATLDARTTEICQQLDGRVVPVDAGPELLPPFHWGCRTTTAPQVKSWEQLGFNAAGDDESLADVRPFVSDTRKVGQIPKADRERLIGTVPDKITMEPWLREQPKHIQNAMLGKTRAEAFRGGESLQDVWMKKAVYTKGKGWSLRQVAISDNLKVPDGVESLWAAEKKAQSGKVGETLLERAHREAREAQQLVRTQTQEQLAELEEKAREAVREQRKDKSVVFGTPDQPLEEAKTVEELTKWAKQRYTWLEDTSFKGFDVETGKTVLKQFDTLAQEYPEVAARLQYLGSFSGNKFYPEYKNERREKLIAFVINQPGEGWQHQLNFNDRWFGNPDALKVKVKGAFKSGFYANGSIESLVTHEFGHMYQGWLMQRYDRSTISVIGQDGTGSVAHTLSQFVNSHGHWIWKADGSGRPSRYSEENGNELFAEAFAQRRHQERSKWSAFTVKFDAALEELDPSNWRSVEDVTKLRDLAVKSLKGSKQAEITAEMLALQERIGVLDNWIESTTKKHPDRIFHGLDVTPVNITQLHDDIGTILFSGYDSDISMDFKAAERLYRSDYYKSTVMDISKMIDRHAGISTRSFRAIGDTKTYGTEPAVVTMVKDIEDFEKLKYAAALKGKTFNQLTALPFIADDDGGDTLWVIDVPKRKGRTDKRLAKQLDEAGIDFRTFIPFKTKTRIVIYDPEMAWDDKQGKLVKSKGLEKNVDAFASAAGVKTVEFSKGRGEFIGDDSSRENARNAYDEIIRSYEARFQRAGQALGHDIDASGNTIESLRIETERKSAQLIAKTQEVAEAEAKAKLAIEGETEAVKAKTEAEKVAEAAKEAERAAKKEAEKVEAEAKRIVAEAEEASIKQSDEAAKKDQKVQSKTLGISGFVPGEVLPDDWSDKQHMKFISEHWKEQHSKLSNRAKGALKYYKGSGQRLLDADQVKFEFINRETGEYDLERVKKLIAAVEPEPGELPQPEEWLKRLRLLDNHHKGIAEVFSGEAVPALDQDLFLYRGMGVRADRAPDLYRAIKSGSMVGNEINSQGFSSTSISRKQAMVFTHSAGDDDIGVMLKIRGREGMPGVGITKWSSAWGKDWIDHEVLLPPGTKYKVVGQRTAVYPARHYDGVVPREVVELEVEVVEVGLGPKKWTNPHAKDLDGAQLGESAVEGVEVQNTTKPRATPVEVVTGVETEEALRKEVFQTTNEDLSESVSEVFELVKEIEVAADSLREMEAYDTPVAEGLIELRAKAGGMVGALREENRRVSNAFTEAVDADDLAQMRQLLRDSRQAANDFKRELADVQSSATKAVVGYTDGTIAKLDDEIHRIRVAEDMATAASATVHDSFTRELEDLEFTMSGFPGIREKALAGDDFSRTRQLLANSEGMKRSIETAEQNIALSARGDLLKVANQMRGNEERIRAALDAMEDAGDVGRARLNELYKELDRSRLLSQAVTEINKNSEMLNDPLNFESVLKHTQRVADLTLAETGTARGPLAAELSVLEDRVAKVQKAVTLEFNIQTAESVSSGIADVLSEVSKDAAISQEVAELLSDLESQKARWLSTDDKGAMINETQRFLARANTLRARAERFARLTPEDLVAVEAGDKYIADWEARAAQDAAEGVVGSIEEEAQFGEEVVANLWGDYVESLDDDLVASLSEYKGSGYDTINEEARFGSVTQQMQDLDDAIDGHTLDRHLQTYRGIGGRTSKRLWTDYESGALRTGGIHENAGYVSTTVDPGIVTEFMRDESRVRMKILLSPGDRAFGFTGFFDMPEEAEVLLPRNSRFQILALRVLARATGSDILEIIVRML